MPNFVKLPFSLLHSQPMLFRDRQEEYRGTDKQTDMWYEQKGAKTVYMNRQTDGQADGQTNREK